MTEPNSPIKTKGLPPETKNLILAIVVSIISTAIIVGGGTYLYQKNEQTKNTADLQFQINNLKSELSNNAPSPTLSAGSKSTSTPTPSPTPMTSSVTASPAAGPAGLTNQQLLNMSYYSLDTNNSLIPLTNGQGYFNLASGGIGSLNIIGNLITAGDLNGDGVPDYIVPLNGSFGPSGTFPMIACVINNNGQPILEGQLMVLGKIANSVIDSISIANGTVTLQGREMSSSQAVGSTATNQVTEKFVLQNNLLVEIN